MDQQQKRPDQTWEDFAEQRIREAYDDGQFAALPGFGQPIAGLDEPHDELWWVKQKLKRERLQHLPPSLEIKLDVQRTLARVSKLRREAEVEHELTELNRRIRDANYRSVWGPPSTQLPLDIPDTLRRWRSGELGE